ncbi:MAG TPA: DUF3617 family protein [Sphingomicrobium sp.]|jgi:hypothetical protein|nr:DUF3617 family protein [Sphingomicrobium sp.]
MRILIIAGAAALVAGCGNSANEKAQAAPTAAALQAGEYRLTWSDIEKSPSAEKAAASAKAAPAVAAADFPASACIATDGTIEPAAFGNTSDQCHMVNSYVREGTVNVQVGCAREGKGEVSQIASGSFTAADSFTAKVETSTSFTGGGNYTMTRNLSAKRVGECTAKQS